MRITYACTVNSDVTVVYGDSGNPNEVELTWKRTNTDYYDTLRDCCHVYAPWQPNPFQGAELRVYDQTLLPLLEKIIS